MNDNAKKWVEALRSGEFKQGQLALCEITEDGDNYCCLGVACQVAVDAGLPVTVTERDLNGRRRRTYDHERTALPTTVRDWLGLSTPGGAYHKHLADTPGTAYSLMGHNDSDKFDFNQIADIIESEPKGLFGEGLFEKPLPEAAS